jgi:hypothetical protein
VTTCRVGDCGRKAVAKELCDGHYRQFKRGQPLTKLAAARGGALGAKDPRDRLKDACFTYQEAVDSDVAGENERAWENLVDAAEWVALGVPKIPRLQTLGYRLLAEVRAKMKAAYKGNEPPADFHSKMHSSAPRPGRG